MCVMYNGVVNIQSPTRGVASNDNHVITDTTKHTIKYSFIKMSLY